MKKITKKLHEYRLSYNGLAQTNDEEIDTSRKYFFQFKTAKEHNEQYISNDVPRRLIRVRGGEVVEVPFWWSGNINRFKKN